MEQILAFNKEWDLQALNVFPFQDICVWGGANYTKETITHEHQQGLSEI